MVLDLLRSGMEKMVVACREGKHLQSKKGDRKGEMRDDSMKEEN